MSGFKSRCWTFISVCNQPATQCQLSPPSLQGGKWVPASAGKAKAGMVHSVSGWMWGVQVIKLWDPLRTRAIPEHLRGMITTRCYTNPRLPYLWACSCVKKNVLAVKFDGGLTALKLSKLLMHTLPFNGHFQLCLQLRSNCGPCRK